jgi:hypothetical protein
MKHFPNVGKLHNVVKRETMKGVDLIDPKVTIHSFVDGAIFLV